MNDIRDLLPGRMRERTFQLKARRDTGVAWHEPQFVECKQCGRRATRQIWAKSLFVCPNCGTHNPLGAKYCNHCGVSLPDHPDNVQYQQDHPAPGGNGPVYANGSYQADGAPQYRQAPRQEQAPDQDFFSAGSMGPDGFTCKEVGPDDPIDGIKARDWASYVGPSSIYYMMQFFRMQETRRKAVISFSAFFLGPFYFFYRKMWKRGLLATLGGQYALVIGCEALSRLMDPADRSTCVLFGDGAGAAIFRLADTPFALTLGARGSDVLHAGGPDRNGSAPITMDGKAVFRFAVDALPRCLHTVLDETGKTLDEVDWVVCHQANSRIIDHCVKALHADAAKFYKNMDRHGNTSAASIPVALNELAESGQLTPGRPLACIGFGGGLTWGGAILQYKE